MNPWIRSLLWVLPREHRSAGLPLLAAGLATLAALTAAAFSAPTRGELERSFGSAWSKATCAAAVAAVEAPRCRVKAGVTALNEARPAWPGPWSRLLPADRPHDAARLSIQTNLDPQLLRQAGADALFWPRMKAALADAAIQSTPDAALPGTSATPAPRKRP